MSNVIPLRPPREESEVPHASGRARCTACKHQWVAVYPVPQEDPWMECPKCGTRRGLYVNHFGLPEGEKIWQCHCGNQLFYVSPQAVHCPGCGNEQRF